jgi:carboxyl-terminal processing protease
MTVRYSIFATALLVAVVLTGCGGGGGGSSGAATTASSASGMTGSSGAGGTSGTTGTSGTSGTTGTSGAGGTSGASGTTGAGGTTSTYVPGQYLAASNYQAKCANPRAGTDPISGTVYPDAQGTVTDENNYLRSWTHQLYLWFDQVPDLDPSQYTTADYFPLLKTSEVTPSGAPVDRFHFTYPTATWEATSVQGVQPGYGVAFDVLEGLPPRNVTVAYVERDATGPAATLLRGDVVQSIDGVNIDAVDAGSVAVLNAGLQPATIGETHTFSVLDVGAVTPRTVVLTSADVTETPVPTVNVFASNGASVGYILFNDHIATAESELIAAFTRLQQLGVADLVLDLRYNGGGFLDIASEVAYMIAGPAQTSGRTFELQQFNYQNQTANPVTGGPITPTLFHSTSQGFSVAAGQGLPTLNLTRVFILTGTATCSASESIINGLRGINVQVIEIGSTTCGKPYGFYPQDNCGTTYFSIEFRGVNAVGFGDYPAGFSPANTFFPSGVVIPGCSVADDFDHALGDQNEGQLSEALAYQVGGACTLSPTGSAIAGQKQTLRPGLPVTARSPFRDIRILRQ